MYVLWITCLSFCTFSFDHCVVCSSSIYGFRLPSLASSNSSYNYITNQVHLGHNIYQIVVPLLFYVIIVACCFISPLCCTVVVLFHLCDLPFLLYLKNRSKNEIKGSLFSSLDNIVDGHKKNLHAVTSSLIMFLR
jgi:hypothetical protein